MASTETPPTRSILWIVALTTLALAAIIASVGVCFAIYFRDRLVLYVSQLGLTAIVGTWLVLAIGRMIYVLRQTRDSAPPRSKIYSFPRRFGLGTLLVLTLAFGALSAFFRWLEWPGEVVLMALFFVGLISAAQFAFDRVPRQASTLTGALLFALWPFTARLLGEPGFTRIPPFDMVFISASSAIAGAITGYCTGTLVGSVFMFIAGANAVMKKVDRHTDQA